MPAEFTTHPPIETISNPYRHEPGSGVAIAITKNELKEAAGRIKDLWSSFVNFGIGQALERAQYEGKIVEFEATDTNGIKAWYRTKFGFSGIDRCAQPIDVFHLIKENPDRDEPPVKMTVATYSGGKTRYSQLVALETEEETEQATGHYFHFSGDDLVLLTQTSRPEVLFPASGRGEPQIIRISRKPDLTDLQLEIGFTDSPQSDYSYQYIGYDLVTTRRLRIADRFTGELELVGIGPDGIIHEPVTFSLPKAVANIANFEPAIAA